MVFLKHLALPDKTFSAISATVVVVVAVAILVLDILATVEGILATLA